MRLLMKTYCVENLYNMPGSISLVKQIPECKIETRGSFRCKDLHK